MLGLAIHTSSPELGLAINDSADSPRHQVWPLGRDLSAHLHTALATFIQPHSWQDLDFLAVAKGPGGFTGTRIGVVTARTLAQQLNVPLFGISSLAAMAAAHIPQEAAPEAPADPITIAVEMQAQRGEVFGAIYEYTGGHWQSPLLDQVYTRNVWQTTLDQWPHPYKAILVEGGIAYTVPHVLTLALEQWQAGARPHWSETLPFYGQHPVR